MCYGGSNVSGSAHPRQPRLSHAHEHSAQSLRQIERMSDRADHDGCVVRDEVAHLPGAVVVQKEIRSPRHSEGSNVIGGRVALESSHAFIDGGLFDIAHEEIVSAGTRLEARFAHARRSGRCGAVPGVP